VLFQNFSFTVCGHAQFCGAHHYNLESSKHGLHVMLLQSRGSVDASPSSKVCKPVTCSINAIYARRMGVSSAKKTRMDD
jgi:hypothetical protein